MSEPELVPAVFGPWAPILIELADPKPGDRVIDIACGTGIVARIAAARVRPSGAVAGVDLNPSMLKVARTSNVAALPQFVEEPLPTSCRFLMARSMSLIASSACSSSPTGPLHCATCGGSFLQEVDSQ